MKETSGTEPIIEELRRLHSQKDWLRTHRVNVSDLPAFIARDAEFIAYAANHVMTLIGRLEAERDEAVRLLVDSDDSRHGYKCKTQHREPCDCGAAKWNASKASLISRLRKD